MERSNIVFFDGVCNLCNTSVQQLVKWDKEQVLSFASLQSEFAKEHLPEKLRLETDSIVFYTKGGFFTESDAVLHLLRVTRGPFRFFLLFSWLPKSFKDGVYRWIARNRYRMFGRKEQCMIPDASLRNRFLS